MSKKASRANWSEKATGKAMVAGDKFARAGRARTSAKGQLTRVTNKMTKKGAAKAKVSPKRAKAKAKAEGLREQRASLKKYRTGKKKAAATRAKTAATKKAAAAKKPAAVKKPAAAKKPQESAKQRYKKAKTAAKTAERFSMVDRGTKEARKGGAAKGKFTKMKKSMRKGATEGKGYGMSKKGQEARAKRIQLIRERGGALKGKGTAAQKRAGIGYRQTQAAFGLKTKGRVPKGRLPGGESLKQQMKSAPKKVANYGERGKGSKAKRRADAIKAQYKKDAREVRMLRKATTASNIPKGAKKNYLKRANEIEGKYNKKRR
jgi:GTP-binding protein